jgi:hypothetical protein
VQDRYVGDIGDFGKYALLRALTGDDLRLGVHWYRNADEEANRDGLFTEYSRLRDCDPQLHDVLNTIVSGASRCITAVESAGVLPKDTVYYSCPLSSRDAKDRATRAERRVGWNARALEVLAPAGIVFMDPDNGIAPASADPDGTTGPKYVFPDELRPFLDRGQSLVVYHHQTREKGGLAATLSRHFEMVRCLGSERVWAFVFRRVSVRVYLIVLRLIMLKS